MKRYLALLPVLGLLLAASGCGAADAVALDPVATAATKTVNTGSSRVAYDVTIIAAGESIRLNGSGAFDYDDPKGFLTFATDIPELGRVELELRMVGTHMYMRLPAALDEGMPEGKQWLSVDLRESMEASGLGGLDFTSQQDPAQALNYLRAAASDMREEGTLDVRGVPTTRYVGRLDLEKALDVGLDQLDLSDADRERTRRSMAQLLDQIGSATMPFEVFIDEGQLLRRMTMTMMFRVEDATVSMTMSMDFYDFGVPVHVTPPPAADVFDATGFVESPPVSG